VLKGKNSSVVRQKIEKQINIHKQNNNIEKRVNKIRKRIDKKEPILYAYLYPTYFKSHHYYFVVCVSHSPTEGPAHHKNGTVSLYLGPVPRSKIIILDKKFNRIDLVTFGNLRVN
jgi:hypothetical protein